jgi:hypothetical protein
VLNCTCLTLLTIESDLGVNNKIVDNFIIFPESLGLPLLGVWISVYN